MPLIHAICPVCGRDYFADRMLGDTDLDDGMPCPSDDCPERKVSRSVSNNQQEG
jgi:hypothetical protein